MTDITKPYLGGYECKSARLGDKEYLEDFSYITLELNKDETFTLYYCPKSGKKGEESGRYSYDEKTETLTLSMGKNNELKRQIPLKDGAFCITVPLGTKTLILQFEQK